MTRERKLRRMASLAATACWMAAAAPAADPQTVRTHFSQIPHVISCRVYLPAGYDPGRRTPLLIALHGSGGSAGSFASLWRRDPRAQCIFAVPEGPYPFPSDRQGGSSGRSWYLLVKEKRVWELADPLSVRAIMATVEELQACYPAGPVYILGFSQGASLAYQAALGHAHAFAGVIAVAGLLPQQALPASGLDKAGSLRVFIAHGSRDARVPPARSAEARARREAAGLQVTMRTFRGGHDIPRELFQEILEWIGAWTEGASRELTGAGRSGTIPGAARAAR